MSRNNDVLRVLPAQTVLSTAGSALSSLNVGQLGVFDGSTNVSLSSATAANARSFYLALGTGSGSTLTGVIRSAGQYIQPKNMVFYNYRHYRAPIPQIVEISEFQVDCDTEYSVRFEIRNQEIYKTQGYVQFTRTFSVTSSCCDKCESCGSGDFNDIANKLVNAINANDIQNAELLSAVLVRPDTNAIVTDYDAYITEFNTANNDDPDSITDITTSLIVRVTTNPAVIQDFCNVNLIDFNPRQTQVIVTLGDEFSCGGATLTTTQDLEYEEGSGYDIKELEYEARGWVEATPYRTDPINMVGKNYTYLTDFDARYSTFTLTYDFDAQAGWEFFRSNLSTYIALPLDGSDEPEGATELVAILDAIISPQGFDTLASDVAANLTNNAISTSELDNVANDGLSD